MAGKAQRIKLSESQDRRRKLSEVQKQEIKDLYETGNFSMKTLASMYEVSKKTILLIVNPESAEKARQYRKENWRNWQRTGEEWNRIQREHRAYKQMLYIRGELKEEK